ncbi:MAG: 4Fe-4S dicluster domain-containing protein [Prevotellaceae bacterium]|nr:4Fe-4S dicluster domain-containing protein [Prevotellaceae bacterium]
MNTAYIILGVVFLLWIAGSLYRRQKNRNKVISVVESNCSGCLRCVKRCTHHVLEMKENETGKRATVKHPDRCTACGDCLGKCRFRALRLIERV